MSAGKPEADTAIPGLTRLRNAAELQRFARNTPDLLKSNPP